MTVRRQIFRQMNRLGGDDKGLLGIAHERDEATERSRMFRLAEKDVEQAFVFLFPAPAVGHQHRHDIDGKGKAGLQLHQAGDGVLGGPALDEFRLSQMNDDAFPGGNFCGKEVQFPLSGERILFESAQERRPEKLHHLGHRLPERHIDAVAVNRHGQAIARGDLGKNQAVEFASLLDGIHHSAAAGQFFQGVDVLVGDGNPRKIGFRGTKAPQVLLVVNTAGVIFFFLPAGFRGRFFAHNSPVSSFDGPGFTSGAYSSLF